MRRLPINPEHPGLNESPLQGDLSRLERGLTVDESAGGSMRRLGGGNRLCNARWIAIPANPAFRCKLTPGAPLPEMAVHDLQGRFRLLYTNITSPDT